MADMDNVLVDTSTVLALNGWPGTDLESRNRFDWDRFIQRDLVTGAIEAMVLFEHVAVDGPSIDRNGDTLG